MNVLLWIFMLSTICEKIEWTVAGFRVKLYWLGGFLFFAILLIKKRGKITLDGAATSILGNRVFLLAFALLQIFIIPATSVMQLQYLKGIISFGIDLTFLLGLLWYVYVTVKKSGAKPIMATFCSVAAVNVFYNVVQRVFTGVDSVVVSLTGSTVTRYGIDPYGQLGRLTGMFTDSNNNGVFLALSIAMFIYAANTLYRNEKTKRTFYRAMAGIASLLVLLTFSLTAYLGLGILLMFYLVKTDIKRQRRMVGLLACAGIGLLALYLTYDPINEIINAKLLGLLGETSEKGSHFDAVVSGMKIWLKDPITFIFGVGSNCMSLYYGSMFGLPGYKAHNYYVQNLGDYGIGGLVAVATLLYILWKWSKPHSALTGRLNNASRGWEPRAVLMILLFANITYDSMVQPFFLVIIAVIYTHYLSKKMGNALPKISNNE